jgi:hypothetical protein
VKFTHTEKLPKYLKIDRWCNGQKAIHRSRHI